MNKKIWIILAIVFVLVGGIIFCGVMATLGWDFSSLATTRYATNTYQVDAPFKSICVEATTDDIVFAPSENGECSVVCLEEKDVTHSVTVENDILTVKVVDQRKWYAHIGIHFQSPSITIYLPRSTYDSLSVEGRTGNVQLPKDFTFDQITVKQTTGGIKAENISTRMLDLSVTTGKVTAANIRCTEDILIEVSTGKVECSDIQCRNFMSDGDTGSITLRGVIAANKLSIERDTGDIKFDGCDAAEIFTETDTGNVKGTLLSEKIFLVSSDTGKIQVPNTVTGGKCEINTDTGDIKVTVSNP